MYTTYRVALRWGGLGGKGAGRSGWGSLGRKGYGSSARRSIFTTMVSSRTERRCRRPAPKESLSRWGPPNFRLDPAAQRVCELGTLTHPGTPGRGSAWALDRSRGDRFLEPQKRDKSTSVGIAGSTIKKTTSPSNRWPRT